jgi:hypothetical protein
MNSSIVNPGTGAIEHSSSITAIGNMKHFLADHDVEDLKFIRVPELDYGQGRYAFLLYKQNGTRYHEIQMPGIPLSTVRFVSNETQNIYDFPRLYVDGSSWLWKYAIKNHSEDWAEPNDLV